MWFDVQLSNVFGFGSTDGSCASSPLSQCYRGGWDFGIAGGVKLKWRTPVPVVIEVPILVGVDVLYNRDCGDTGVGVPAIRGGLTARYFLKKNIAVGAGINLAFGPGFHGGGNPVACQEEINTPTSTGHSSSRSAPSFCFNVRSRSRASRRRPKKTGRTVRPLTRRHHWPRAAPSREIANSVRPASPA